MDKRLVAFGRLLDVMDELREKCPWDREQTFASLRNNTIEETFELADAIFDKDMQGIREELGDLLLHIVFYSKIADEQGEFDMADVANGICDKLIYRHPHVFGDVQADNPQEVMTNWEELKLKEKARQNKKKRVLSGVPRSLPAMVKAYRMGQKAASAGFDWEKKEDVWKKVGEEMAEVEAEIVSQDKEHLSGEFGDLFFSLINAARLYGVDPETALESSNKKFIRRFGHVEECAEKAGKSLKELSLQQMEGYWLDAKRSE